MDYITRLSLQTTYPITGWPPILREKAGISLAASISGDALEPNILSLRKM
jgi:hypothetical protein